MNYSGWYPVFNVQFEYRLNDYRSGIAESIPLTDACVDLVTGANVLHWIHSEKMSKEIDRMLKPGGWFIFYGWGAPRPRIELTDDTYEVHKEFLVRLYYV